MAKDNQPIFDKLEKIMKARVRETKLYLDEVKKIQSYDAWSDREKERQTNALQETHYKYGNDAYELVSGVMAELFTAADELDNNIDFINDPELANAMKMIKITDGDVPEQLITQLNEKYRTNPHAINMLISFYKKHNVQVFNEDFPNTDTYTSRLNNIEDGFYYSFSQENPDLSGITNRLNNLAKEMGAKFDVMSYDAHHEEETRMSGAGGTPTAKIGYLDYVGQGISL